MNTLYFVTAYYWKGNEWWRFAISAPSEAEAIKKFAYGYSAMRFVRINAVAICQTNETVFKEL